MSDSDLATVNVINDYLRYLNLPKSILLVTLPLHYHAAE